VKNCVCFTVIFRTCSEKQKIFPSETVRNTPVHQLCEEGKEIEDDTMYKCLLTAQWPTHL
jgi:hypothetical protein